MIIDLGIVKLLIYRTHKLTLLYYITFSILLKIMINMRNVIFIHLSCKINVTNIVINNYVFKEMFWKRLYYKYVKYNWYVGN